jgi:hypothetical protein
VKILKRLLLLALLCRFGPWPVPVLGRLAEGRSAASAAQTEAQYIPARNYFPTLIAEINKARESVTAYMYLYSLYPERRDSMSLQLAEALGAARARGLKVEVVLDEGRDIGTGQEFHMTGVNEFLRAKGVDVYFEDSPRTLHAKAVVIDGETALVGSTNWSEAAFGQNAEANVLVRGAAARSLSAELGAIPRKAPPSVPTVPVPWAFFTEKGYMPAMTVDQDGRGFDLYLYLLQRAHALNTREFPLDYDGIASHLGMEAMGRKQYRAKINLKLRHLRDKYSLIDLKTAYNQDALVTLRDLPASPAVQVPQAYWDLGWNKRLSMSGKALYMLGLYYSANSPQRPRWSLSWASLQNLNHISKNTLASGNADLRRANLLDVAYDKLPEKPTDPREPNIYTPLPLYDPAELEKTWLDMEKEFGKERLARGRKYAALVYKDSDAGAVRALIELETRYGRPAMDRALKILGRKNNGNPKRTVDYLINTVKRLAREENRGL